MVYCSYEKTNHNKNLACSYYIHCSGNSKKNLLSQKKEATTILTQVGLDNFVDTYRQMSSCSCSRFSFNRVTILKYSINTNLPSGILIEISLTQLCGHKTENYVLSISWYELALRSGTTSFILSGCQCSFDYFPGMTLHPQ